MLEFQYSSEIQAPVERVFAFHEEPAALELLTPPWQPAKVLSREGGIREGARVVLEVPLGPFRRRWVAVHTAYEANRLFEDTQLEGPFRAWRHRHEFHDLGQGRTRLVDRILFSLPGGPLADLLAGWLAKNQLARMFRYRHEVTRRCCEQHADNPAGGYSAGA